MEISTKLKEQLELLKLVDFATLSRKEELGQDYNFSEAVVNLKRIYDDLFEVVQYASILRVPNSIEEVIGSIAIQLNEIVKSIQDFRLKGNEPAAPGQHQQIHTRVITLYQRDLEVLVPLIDRGRILKLNPKEIEKEASIALRHSKEIEKIREDVEKSKSSVEATIKQLGDSLGKEGAGRSAAFFSQQASQHERMARKWLVASIITIFSTGGLMYVLFRWPELDLTNYGDNFGRIAQVVLLKGVLLSLAYLAVYLTLKNYRVNRHLYIMNNHRQLCLDVYRLMVNATKGPEETNVILTQATKAIFEPGTTGYLDGTDTVSPLNLTGIVNKIIDKNS